MAYHSDFWVAVTTASPVLILAHAVVVQRSDASRAALYELFDAQKLTAELIEIEARTSGLQREVDVAKKLGSTTPGGIGDLERRLAEHGRDLERFKSEWRQREGSVRKLPNVTRELTRRSVFAMLAILLAAFPFLLGLTSLADETDNLLQAALFCTEVSLVCFVAELVWGARIRNKLPDLGVSAAVMED